ncbi:MAG: PilZ domain-containing protein [Proteobacteria bacterium]|nr:PilZ domain-containing protein [Pseudomonadota bacterium]MBU1640566.1 PilZ domain-containing protein [Pseudomonadota bacterium]
MDSETRVMKRRHLFYYLEVFDAISGQQVGNLVDISTRGCKLVSRNKIPKDQEMTLRIMLPEEYHGEKELIFAARSVWSANDINPDFYDTGFEVPLLGLEERKVIRVLLKGLASTIKKALKNCCTPQILRQKWSRNAHLLA